MASISVLILTLNEETNLGECIDSCAWSDDIVVFDPMRVTDGIEPSDDPILRFRTHAYSTSVKLRTGVDRGAEAPPG